jgi:hypothetical protein
MMAPILLGSTRARSNLRSCPNSDESSGYLRSLSVAVRELLKTAEVDGKHTATPSTAQISHEKLEKREIQLRRLNFSRGHEKTGV